MKRGLLAAALAAVLGSTGCIDGNFGASVRESVDVSRPLAASGKLTLQNTNGSVRVGVWDEGRVRIEAVKAAASERALRDLEVVIEGEGEHVDVRSRMPGGHWFGRSGRVDYTITVPRGANVSVRNVNGRVEIRDVAGLRPGRERQRLARRQRPLGRDRGLNRQRQRRGADGAAAPSSRNRVSSTNGSVRVTLPRDVAADVEASTVNGSVHCDFELDGGHSSRRKVEGRIGGGGARLELQTVNGSATIDRGLSAAVGRGPRRRNRRRGRARLRAERRPPGSAAPNGASFRRTNAGCRRVTGAAGTGPRRPP